MPLLVASLRRDHTTRLSDEENENDTSRHYRRGAVGRNHVCVRPRLGAWNSWRTTPSAAEQTRQRGSQVSRPGANSPAATSGPSRTTEGSAAAAGSERA